MNIKAASGNIKLVFCPEAIKIKMLITAGSQANCVRELGQTGNRAAISDSAIVSGKPGRLENYPGCFKICRRENI
jgi:hypothetical protein